MDNKQAHNDAAKNPISSIDIVNLEIISQSNGLKSSPIYLFSILTEFSPNSDSILTLSCARP